MKVRNGFVSNSSSSSFIINGVKLSNEEYGKKFYNDYSDEEQDDSKLTGTELNDIGLTTEADRFYSSSDEPNGFVVGVDAGGLEDGVVEEFELTEDDKQVVVDRLMKVGIEIKIEDVKTYIQFISNDNY